MTINKSISEISLEASLLIGEFSQLDKGSVITYERIEQLIGFDVRDKRSIMVTVGNRLIRDHGKIIDPVPKVGYRILTDAEAVEGRLRRDRESRRRSAHRSKIKAGAVDTAKLNETQRIGYLAEVTAAHVTLEASTEKSVKQIASSMNGAQQPLALNNALEAMKHNVK